MEKALHSANSGVNAGSCCPFATGFVKTKENLYPFDFHLAPIQKITKIECRWSEKEPGESFKPKVITSCLRSMESLRDYGDGGYNFYC